MSGEFRSRARAGKATSRLRVMLVVLLSPFLWLLQMSFKTNDLILQFPPPLIFKPTLENYTSLWHSAFSASFVNSLLSASFSTALRTCCSGCPRPMRCRDGPGGASMRWALPFW